MKHVTTKKQNPQNIENEMKKHLFSFIFLFAISLTAMAQAKKPTLMVFPSDVWCNEHGYMTTYDNQGKITKVPDYERLTQESAEMMQVISKLSEMMTERGFPLKDLNACIRMVNESQAEDEIMQSRTSGAEVAISPMDALLLKAKADIRLMVYFKVESLGPRRTVQFSIDGIDAYTGKNIASASGTSPSLAGGNTIEMLQSAVLKYIDNFNSQLQQHFDDLFANGREVALSIRVFDNGSGLSLEDEYGDEELSEVIENWMDANTVAHRFSTSTVSENTMEMEQIRIPLYDERERPMDTKRWARGLVKYLNAEPYNITSKVVAKGLGKVNIYLGEK